MFVRATYPCISAQGVVDLLAYARNAKIVVSADNMVFRSGDTYNFNSTGRKVDVFANRVTIQGSYPPYASPSAAFQSALVLGDRGKQEGGLSSAVDWF